jgi:heptosyltransferase-2
VRAKEIFAKNPKVNSLLVYDKRARLKDKIKLYRKLSSSNFDLIADLRNSFMGVILPAKYKISPFLRIPNKIKHMKEKHLYKVENIKAGINPPSLENKSLGPDLQEAQRIGLILKDNNIVEKDKIIVLAPGARSHTKRWPKERFAELSSRLIKDLGARIILVGDKEDAEIAASISAGVNYPILDLSGKTSIGELCALLKRAGLLITNDSATLHIGSYLNIPVLAIFGITDDRKYGPWSSNSLVVKREIFCRPCERAQCRFGTLECIKKVTVEEVFEAAQGLLNHALLVKPTEDFKRILIARTDRIGDVLLSTPVIRALRDKYPYAYISMMVSEYAKGVVEGNKYLDEVIVYDKDREHKSWLSSMKFALSLKKKKFDLAVILHPTSRVHLLTFFAGIPRRIGYNKKLGFLLTDKIAHTKQFGEKHELEYNLDLIRALGIEAQDKSLIMPIREESEKWVNELFRLEGIKGDDRLLAVHPSASCPSKIWPAERFAVVAERLSNKYGFKILVVVGPSDTHTAETLIKQIHGPVIGFAGKTSVSQLASLLKRCELFISNDSGPVHIASAVGTPVISIFGRSQPGLSPKRWGPVGLRDMFLHKDIGCIECFAHNCKQEFACLKAISVDDVISCAENILNDR